ncbi:MAG: glycine--tRNA ligase subunit beta [Woeseiaceae bacterium]
MSKRLDFLVEIGTEELPPKALRPLMEAFRNGLEAAIDDARLEHGDVFAYASPRRLAVIVRKLAMKQEDRSVEQKGPPVRVAFDDAGNPTPAATAFAKKCGVAIDELNRTESEKGAWLSFDTVDRGRASDELMPELVERVLGALPIPRRMRWVAVDAEIVRPVHWVVLLHG